MKMYVFSLLGLFFLISCGDGQKLSKEQALDLILKDQPKSFPVTYQIYVNDPAEADKIRATQLGEQGYVQVYAPGETIAKDSFLINLTTKGKEFLLPESAADSGTLSVKVAKAIIDADAEHLQLAFSEDGSQATASYQLSYSDVTPFAVLVPQRDFKAKESRTVQIHKAADGWKIEQSR